MNRGIAGAVLLALAAAAPAAAQSAAGCSALLTAPAQGGWSEYNVRSSDGRSAIARFAIVGTERRDNRPLVWFENRVANPQGEVQIVSHVLVPGFPYQAAAPMAAVLQGTRGSPIRLNEAALTRARRSLPEVLRNITDACERAAFVAEEDVTVAAGEVRARHYRDAGRGVDIWVSEEVPFGVVKLTNAGNRSSVELRGRGEGARSSLRAAPVDMEASQ